MVSGNLKAKSSVRSGIGGDFQLDFAPTELVLFCVSNYKDLASTEPAMASAESRPKPNHVFRQPARSCLCRDLSDVAKRRRWGEVGSGLIEQPRALALGLPVQVSALKVPPDLSVIGGIDTLGLNHRSVASFRAISFVA